MLQPILFQKQPLAYLHENEINILAAIAPYWGLNFDQENRTIKPALAEKYVFISSQNKRNDFESLRQLLKHTSLNFCRDRTQAHVCIQVFSLNQKQHTPISIQIDNAKYHLKYMKDYHKNLQTLIHRNIWLPKRHHIFSITFCQFSEERKMEIIAYLIIQFFLKDKMLSLSHIPFPIYEKLIQRVLTPINQSFAYIQNTVYRSLWPETPPELTHINKSSSSPLENAVHPFMRRTTSHPPARDPINPFRKKQTSFHNIIDPFKKNTQNPNQ